MVKFCAQDMATLPKAPPPVPPKAATTRLSETNIDSAAMPPSPHVDNALFDRSDTLREPVEPVLHIPATGESTTSPMSEPSGTPPGDDSSPYGDDLAFTV